MGSVLGELCQKVRGHGVGTGGAVSEGEGSQGRYWGGCVRR